MDEMQYNKGDEEKLIKRYYEKAIQSFNKGRISKAVYEGTTGLLGSAEERQRGMYRISSASIKPRAEAPRENLERTEGKAIKKQPPTLEEEAVFVVPKKLERLAERIKKAKSIDELKEEIIKEGKAIELNEELHKAGMNLGEFWNKIREEKISEEIEAEPTEEEMRKFIEEEIGTAEEFEKEEGKKAEERASILLRLELAKAGKRFTIVDEDGHITDQWTGHKSTLPKWVPEKLRRKKLINAVLEPNILIIIHYQQRPMKSGYIM